MDGLFRTFGVRNVTVIIDEIPDATKKINVGRRATCSCQRPRK